MSNQENFSLILHQGQDLALGVTARSPIIEEMTSGTLSHIPQLESELNVASSETWFHRGESFYYGSGVDQNFIEAVKCYETAAKMGHKDALCNLACLASAGLGMKANPEAAFELFERLAYGFDEVGEMECHNWWVASKVNAAECYWLGLGVEQNDLGWSAMLRSVEKVSSDARLLKLPGTTTCQRSKDILTCFDIVAPGPLAIYESGNERKLHKIRILRHDDKYLQKQALVIDGGDSGFTCGDLIDLEYFKNRSEFTCEEGGKPAYGLVFAPFSDGAKNSEFIVGHILHKTVHITPEKGWSKSVKVQVRLRRMGLDLRATD